MQMGEPNETLEQLYATYKALMLAQIDDFTDMRLKEIRRIEALISDLALVDKVVAGDTRAIIEHSRRYRMRYSSPTMVHNDMSIEEYEINKLHRQVESKIRNYNTTEDIKNGVMQGELSLYEARELVNFINDIGIEQINDMFEEINSLNYNSHSFDEAL